MRYLILLCLIMFTASAEAAVGISPAYVEEWGVFPGQRFYVDVVNQMTEDVRFTIQLGTFDLDLDGTVHWDLSLESQSKAWSILNLEAQELMIKGHQTARVPLELLCVNFESVYLILVLELRNGTTLSRFLVPFLLTRDPKGEHLRISGVTKIKEDRIAVELWNQNSVHGTYSGFLTFLGEGATTTKWWESGRVLPGKTRRFEILVPKGTTTVEFFDTRAQRSWDL